MTIVFEKLMVGSSSIKQGLPFMELGEPSHSKNFTNVNLGFGEAISTAGAALSQIILVGPLAVYPIDVSISPDENFKRWKYVSYNFTLATYWSPFLIRMKEADADGPTKTGLFSTLS
ncbi:hypothetical protein HAX54_030588 [Datura stramonium]|uniref:Uncharacterized protein n=1 Tax=Datura stramonium TaxID=4076 RepID=A0ABS8VAS7_DATST|nr:hypothetical protein [Datura stramonium]